MAELVADAVRQQIQELFSSPATPVAVVVAQNVQDGAAHPVAAAQPTTVPASKGRRYAQFFQQKARASGVEVTNANYEIEFHRRPGFKILEGNVVKFREVLQHQPMRDAYLLFWACGWSIPEFLLECDRCNGVPPTNLPISPDTDRLRVVDDAYLTTLLARSLL